MLYAGANTSSKIPVIIQHIIHAFIRDFPSLLVFMEAVYDLTHSPGVLKAVEGFLANLPFIDVYIMEEFHKESLGNVPEVSGLGAEEVRANALKHIWESKLCERYRCNHIELTLVYGGVIGEYHLPLSVFAFMDLQSSNSATILKLQVTLPSSLAWPLSGKGNESVINKRTLLALANSGSNVPLSRRHAMRRTLEDEFGIHWDVTDSILPTADALLQYLTIPEHVESYISTNSGGRLG